MTTPESRRVVLLATATIDPKGMPNVARADPAVRLNDYRNSLARWLDTTDLPVVFCENSGTDLAPLRESVGARADRVEFLSFTAESFPAHKGKGYGEALIVSHALEHSRLITPDVLVAKTTGRLFLSNYGRIWEEAKRHEFGVCSRPLKYGLTYVDTRFFIARPEILRRIFVERREELDEREATKVYIEDLTAQEILRYVLSGGLFHEIPGRLSFRGFSGTADIPLDPFRSTLPFRAARRLRKMVRGR